MNQYQHLWWEQAACDHAAFKKLRGQGFAQCHTLQFLQMATEKIAKAYGLARQLVSCLGENLLAKCLPSHNNDFSVKKSNIDSYSKFCRARKAMVEV